MARKAQRGDHLPDGVRSIVDWLIAGAPPHTDPVKIVEDFGTRTLAAGLPVDRFGFFVATLHPSSFGRRFMWQPETGVEVSEAPFATNDNPLFRNSPAGQVFLTGKPLRVRLDGPLPEEEHPVLTGLRQDGFTDYLILPLTFTNGSNHAVIWATKKRGGFDEGDLAAFDALQLPIARLAEIYSLKRLARNLLDTYVGERTGERILAGRIHRGDVDAIEAAIWLSDLRGFTALADALPGDALIEMLNDHFDRLVPAVRSHGGEVLKFMGDGMLAIFPFIEGRSSRDACVAALDAALAARDDMKALNDDRADAGLQRLDFGIALHVGRVHYGNIGGANRLDFTAIGPAVNFAARLETVAAATGRDIVMSRAFRDAAGLEADDLGMHLVKGYNAPVAVYGVPAAAFPRSAAADDALSGIEGSYG